MYELHLWYFLYIYRSGQANEHRIIDPTIKGSKLNMIHLWYSQCRNIYSCTANWQPPVNSEPLSVWTTLQMTSLVMKLCISCTPNADRITVWESEMPAFLDVVMQTSASESCLYQVCLPASTSARRQEVKSTCHVTKASRVYTGLKESGRVMMVSRHAPLLLTPTHLLI